MERNDGKAKARKHTAKEFIAAHKKAKSPAHLAQILRSTPGAVAVRANKLRNEGYKIPTFREKAAKEARSRK